MARTFWSPQGESRSGANGKSMLGRYQTIRRFSQPRAFPPNSSTSDVWGPSLRPCDSTHPYLAPMQPWPQGTPQGWYFPTARTLAKISHKTVQKRHEILTSLHVFYLFQQFHHTPRIRTDIPAFCVVNFQASSAISCGAAIRTGISTPALLNASNRRLSNVKNMPCHSKTRIGGTSCGLMRPLCKPIASSSMEVPSRNVALMLA